MHMTGVWLSPQISRADGSYLQLLQINGGHNQGPTPPKDFSGTLAIGRQGRVAQPLSQAASALEAEAREAQLGNIQPQATSSCAWWTLPYCAQNLCYYFHMQPGALWAMVWGAGCRIQNAFHLSQF